MTQEVFRRVLELVCNVFEAYSAVLFLPEGEGEACRLAASFSLGDGINPDLVLAPGQGLVGWIIREKKPLLIGNFDQKRGVLGYYAKGEEAQIRAFLGCPLPGVEGALCLDSKKIHSFTDKNQRILHDFAQLVSWLYLELTCRVDQKEQARFRDGLERLLFLPGQRPKWNPYLHDLLDLMAEFTGFSHCFLAVSDEASGTFTIEGATQPLFLRSMSRPKHFTQGGGMIGWVFKNQSPVNAEDGGVTAMRLFGRPAGSRVFGSVICHPVIFSGRTRAVLALCDVEQVKINQNVRDFAKAGAEQLGQYLENLHLKAKLSWPKA